MILQKELQLIKEKRDYFKVINDKLVIPKAELSDLENGVIKRLKKGEKVEPGSLQVILNRTERRTPPWKALLEQIKGRAYIEKVIKDTNPTETEVLIIDDIVKKEGKA